MKAWMLTITGRKKYWGNESYGNDPVRSYSYDAYVQNHKALSVGDLVVIREGDEITGASILQEITQRQKQKSLNECPKCGTGRVRFRKTISPQWVCENGDQFSEPNKVSHRTVGYTATFDRNYKELVPSIKWQELDQSFLNKSAISIRGLSIDEIMASPSPALLPLKRLSSELIGAQLDNLQKAEIETAKRAVNQLRDFLKGCRSMDDNSTRSCNKLELPMSQEDFSSLIAGVDVVHQQLDSPAPDTEKIEESSFLMEQFKLFMASFVRGAGTKSGELAASGMAGKLIGYLEAAINALRALF